MDRDGAFGGADGAGVTVAIVDSGVERDHPAVGGKLIRSVRVEPGEEEPVVVDDPRRSTSSATGRPAPGSSTGSPRTPTSSRSACSGPDNRGKGAIFAAGLEWAIDQGASVVNLSLSSKSEAMFAVFHELADAGLLRQRAAGQRREQRARAELPVAVRVGRVGRRARRRRPVDAGSTTRPRRSSSARTASTSTSPGRTAGGSSRPATASPRRTSPGSPR